jgi:arylsulfatase A
MRTFKNFTLLIICIAFVACNAITQEKKPNIVMLYIDDWAWNGSPVPMNDSMENSRLPVVEMPNLEKLASEGMKFNNAYGSPQCAPARVCLQTGQSAPRSGYTVVLGKTNKEDTYYDTRKVYQNLPVVPTLSDPSIDEDAVTIPEVLKPLGYVSAHLGKWHMYSNPEAEGYVLSDGETTNNEGNTLKRFTKKGDPMPTRLTEELMTDPKLMFSITEKGIGFMEEQVKAGKPFYLQMSHYAMHAGSECKVATREKYVNHPLVQKWYELNNTTAETVNRHSDPAVWLGMANDLDGRIGVVLDKIKDLGIEDNTYVIVVADNGFRHTYFHGFKQPLHARKWWIWQGGIRVPMIVKGPGIKSSSVFKGNVVNYDFLPTFFDWAGGNPDTLQNIDGVSLAEYMAGKEPDETFLNRNLYFHYPHYRESMPSSAIISGSSKVMHFYERPDVPMLFDLSKDAGEVINIAKQNPETHQKLYNEMMQYLEEVGARIPKINPDYDPEVYQNMKGYENRMQWGPFEGQRTLDDDEK